MCFVNMARLRSVELWLGEEDVMSKMAQKRKRKEARRKKTAPWDRIKAIKRRSRGEIGSIPPGKFYSSKKGNRGYDRKDGDHADYAE